MSHTYKVMKTKLCGELQKDPMRQRDQGMRRQLELKRLEVIQMGENNSRFMKWWNHRMVWAWTCFKDHLPWAGASSSRPVHTHLHRDELGVGPVSLMTQILGLSWLVQSWLKNNVGTAEKERE